MTKQPHLHWIPLPPIPDAEGFAGGFAGVSHDTLLYAGGANFAGKRAWDGGTKQWYDTVYVLRSPGTHWEAVGKLPHLNGYGVSGTWHDELIVAGGGDSAENYADVFALSWDGRNLHCRQLPPLPQRRAFMGGTVVDNSLYVACGTAQTQFVAVEALRDAWVLDLARPNSNWRELEPLPGPGRAYPIAGAMGTDFYLFGGISLRPDNAGRPARTYLRDAYVYSLGKGWSRIADLPHPLAGAPSPAAVTPDGRLIIMTGDDGTRLKLDGPDHPGFPEKGILYDPYTNQWSAVPEIPISRSCAPTAIWRDMWVVVGGERKPGYRTPETWGLQLESR